MPKLTNSGKNNKLQNDPGRKNAADNTVGTDASEHLVGGAREDEINGLGGNDFINTGAKSDIASGGSGNDFLELDADDDIGVYVAADNIDGAGRYTDIYDGGSGIDTLRLVLTADDAADPVLQQEIAEYLQFLADNTLPNGMAKNVEYTFDSLSLTVTRFEDLDVVVEQGDDCPCEDLFVITGDTIILEGTEGNDRLIGDGGEQTVYGYGGNDTIAGRPGDDQLSGGDGDDFMIGDNGDDLMCGGAGNDTMNGNSQDDILYGCEGDDFVRGGEGQDVVYGGKGNDIVAGDEGDDEIYGGAGADIFLYGDQEKNNPFGDDVVKDFALGEDRIQIDLAGEDFDTYAEVIAVATDTADGVLFTFRANETLLVEGITVASLSSDDFVF